MRNQYAIPPDDLFTNPAYDSRLPQIEIWQEDAFTKMAAIPTIDDQKVHFVRMWLPYEASKAPNFKLWLGSLRYCPTTVQNFCGDGKGGFMSPMAAMFGNGKLRSASWGVIQLIFEHLYWMFAKMNTTPVVKAYKGTVYKLYTKKNYERLQKIYTNFVEKVFSVCDRIMFFSKGVLTELEEMFGTVRSMTRSSTIYYVMKRCYHLQRIKSSRFIIQRNLSISSTVITALNGCANGTMLLVPLQSVR